ncbi:MAG: type II secretion system protein GspM [Alphaproteobacteria bacterium]|jgi:general secretion pathway protein M
MKLVLSAQRQRVLALVLLAGVLLLALQLVIWPFWEAAQLHGQRVALLRRQVLVMEGLVEARPAFEAAVAKLAGNAELQALTLSGDSAAIGGAQLQGQLTQILTAAPASVTSAQLLPEETAGGLALVRMQMAAETDMRGLVSALHAIGGARPLLAIDRIAVRDPDGVFAMKPEKVLSNRLAVEMVVSARMRAP